MLVTTLLYFLQVFSRVKIGIITDAHILVAGWDKPLKKALQSKKEVKENCMQSNHIDTYLCPYKKWPLLTVGRCSDAICILKLQNDISNWGSISGRYLKVVVN